MIRLKHLLSESLVNDAEFRELVKDWEGKVTNAAGLHVSYDDETGQPVQSPNEVKGVLTIGYGTTKTIFPELKPGLKISEKQADNLLTKGIKTIEDTVKRKIPQYDSYPRYVRVAIMNASYRGDLGPATIKLINQGAWDKVSKEYLNHSNYTSPGSLTGVVKRMKSNADAFDRYAKERVNKTPAGVVKSKQPYKGNIGRMLYPRKTPDTNFANVRNEPVINNGFITNIISRIEWPNPVGVAKAKKFDAQGKAWYYVELPVGISSSYKHGWVRYDVVTANKDGKYI
jgi:GH24 family phage-related lysozyme (muramidase)